MKIFINPSGQRDNLGDSALRRAALDRLRRQGELHVFVGEHEAYNTGLGLQSADRLYASQRSWFLTALSQGRDAAFALNPGEMVASREFLCRFPWQYALCASYSLRRRPVIALGVGVRSRPVDSLWAVRLLTHRARTVWRDSRSATLVGVGEVGPDWAFGLAPLAVPGDSSTSSHRPYLVISMRGDRSRPTAAWYDAVKAIADRDGLRIAVASQVKRDICRSEEIGAALGAEVVPWVSDLHQVQEQAIRELYGQSAVVVSDRLHALVFAAVEGAYPVGLLTEASTKIGDVFGVVTDLVTPVVASDQRLSPATLERIAPTAEKVRQLRQDVRDAAGKLDRIGADWTTP